MCDWAIHFPRPDPASRSLCPNPISFNDEAIPVNIRVFRKRSIGFVFHKDFAAIPNFGRPYAIQICGIGGRNDTANERQRRECIELLRQHRDHLKFPIAKADETQFTSTVAD